MHRDHYHWRREFSRVFRYALLAVLSLLPRKCLHAQSVPAVKLSLPLPSFVTRADLYVDRVSITPKAVLILCPGLNGNGGDWIREPAWQSFARQQDLALAGISFESDPNDRAHGYHDVRDGSGQALLDGLRTVYGRDLPLLLYGYSRGAVFVCRFADWKPERVLGWCAYTPGEGDDQSAHVNAPPGLIACGEEDSNYGWAMFYFKKGRALGKPWLWLSVANTGHVRSAQVENFAREYLAAMLDKQRNPLWVDIDEKANIPFAQATAAPSLSALLPESSLYPYWNAIDEP